TGFNLLNRITYILPCNQTITQIRLYRKRSGDANKMTRTTVECSIHAVGGSKATGHHDIAIDFLTDLCGKIEEIGFTSNGLSFAVVFCYTIPGMPFITTSGDFTA